MIPEQAQVNAERERRVARNLLEGLKVFYKDPKNREAYEAWKKSKEAEKYADYINS